MSDASCRRLYCDQVLEHLSRNDVHRALCECRRMLAADGVFRLFVPDLRRITKGYTEMVQQGRADAGEWFMEATGLGFTQRPRGLKGRLIELLGNARHLWAWDVDTMATALKAAGFSKVREVTYRDSGDAVFDELEKGVSWQLALGMEARL